jgi:hypothetical protein
MSQQALVELGGFQLRITAGGALHGTSFSRVELLGATLSNKPGRLKRWLSEASRIG